jgi:hypothetical protein
MDERIVVVFFYAGGCTATCGRLAVVIRRERCSLGDGSRWIVALREGSWRREKYRLCVSGIEVSPRPSSYPVLSRLSPA